MHGHYLYDSSGQYLFKTNKDDAIKHAVNLDLCKGKEIGII